MVALDLGGERSVSPHPVVGHRNIESVLGGALDLGGERSVSPHNGRRSSLGPEGPDKR